MFFERQDEDQTMDEEFERELLAPYQGIAVLATNKCQPIHIPSVCEIDINAMEAMLHRPTFLIVIWKLENSAV